MTTDTIPRTDAKQDAPAGRKSRRFGALRGGLVGFSALLMVFCLQSEVAFAQQWGSAVGAFAGAMVGGMMRGGGGYGGSRYRYSRGSSRSRHVARSYAPTRHASAHRSRGGGAPTQDAGNARETTPSRDAGGPKESASVSNGVSKDTAAATNNAGANGVTVRDIAVNNAAATSATKVSVPASAEPVSTAGPAAPSPAAPSSGPAASGPGGGGSFH